MGGKGGAPRPPKYRMRYKAYGVREYGSSTLHYAHEFLDFETAKGWPSLMRRVLVPLVQPAGGGAARGKPWQLDTVAGVHHRSDRMANGPRKWADKYSATLREREVVVCRRPKP